jgi:hypothetical protein
MFEVQQVDQTFHLQMYSFEQVEYEFQMLLPNPKIDISIYKNISLNNELFSLEDHFAFQM